MVGKVAFCIRSANFPAKDQTVKVGGFAHHSVSICPSVLPQPRAATDHAYSCLGCRDRIPWTGASMTVILTVLGPVIRIGLPSPSGSGSPLLLAYRGLAAFSPCPHVTSPLCVCLKSEECTLITSFNLSYLCLQIQSHCGLGLQWRSLRWW